jgi:hypothetical protein
MVASLGVGRAGTAHGATFPTDCNRGRDPGHGRRRASTFSVSPASGPVGSTVTVANQSPCPTPAGAGDWIAIVKFAQGTNGEVSFKDFAVDPSGNWGGSFTIPYAATGAAQLTAACFDATHTIQTELDYQPDSFTVKDAAALLADLHLKSRGSAQAKASL